MAVSSSTLAGKPSGNSLSAWALSAAFCQFVEGLYTLCNNVQIALRMSNKLQDSMECLWSCILPICEPVVIFLCFFLWAA